MQDLKITLVQADLFWEQPAANMAMFEEKLWTMSEETDLIVLPEMFTTGFSMNPSKLAEAPHTNTYKWMYQIAKEKSALLIGSYMVKENGHNYNRMYAVFPEGQTKYYDKRHLFTLADEGESYTRGKRRLILEWKGWRICPMVCYDLRFPVWSRNSWDTASDQCDFDLLVYAANWPKPRINAWDTLLKARAIENQCYVAGVNRVGADDAGHQYVGHSAIYDHLGELVGTADEQEMVFSETLEARAMMDFRRKYPFLKDADTYTID